MIEYGWWISISDMVLSQVEIRRFLNSAVSLWSSGFCDNLIIRSVIHLVRSCIRLSTSLVSADSSEIILYLFCTGLQFIFPCVCFRESWPGVFTLGRDSIEISVVLSLFVKCSVLLAWRLPSTNYMYDLKVWNHLIQLYNWSGQVLCQFVSWFV